jgi:cytoskeletal protein RodZ
LEGQVVDGTFQLSDYLGGSPDSAVFLTSISGEPPKLAAIKLIPQDLPHAQERLACWRFASTLFHPNLIQIFQAGHGTVNGKKYLYAVMEYAEENLGQIVPQRTLTEEEVSMLLVPTLNALEYLHANGLVHGHIKPSDIMAMGDRLKVSMDGVKKPGEAIDAAGAPVGAGVASGNAGNANGGGSVGTRGGRDEYDPPEATSTAAGDVWSLGVTLVEELTQHKPQWDPRTQADPVVPENLPGSLRDIARNCLRRDPKRRWTIAGIGMRLRAPLDNPLDGYAGGVQGAGAAGAAGAGAHEAAVGAAAGVSAPVAGTYAEVTLPERVDVGVRGGVAGAGVATSARAGATTSAAADLTGGAGAPAVTAGGVSAAARTAPMRDIAQDLRMAGGDTTTAGLRATLAESSANVNAEAEHSTRGYLALAVIVFLVVVALLGFKLLHPTPKATGETTQTTTAVQQPTQQSETPAQNAPGTNGAEQNAAATGGSATQSTATQSGGQNPTSTQGGTQSAAPSGAANQSSAPAGNGANAAPTNATNANAPVNSAATQGAQVSEGAAGSGVVHQVIPEASQKSLSTIYGAVRVGIKVTAGASGEVTDATIDSEGPSTYFANLSLAAARQWKFAGSGSWELRFEFRNDGAKVIAEKE